MFNVTGSEILILLVLALVVVGPERLPEVIRKFGKTYGELKKMSTGFQTELRDALDEPMREMRATADEIRRTIEEPINETVKTGNEAIKAGLSGGESAQPESTTESSAAIASADEAASVSDGTVVTSGESADVATDPAVVSGQAPAADQPAVESFVRPSSPFDTAKSSASPRSAPAAAAADLYARARQPKPATFAPPASEPLPPPNGGVSRSTATQGPPGLLPPPGATVVVPQSSGSVPPPPPPPPVSNTLPASEASSA